MNFKRYIVAILLILFYVTDCTTDASGTADVNKVDYRKIAYEQPFEKLFPSSDFKHTFSTIDEAYDYINIADRKFGQTVRIPLKGKGNLAAKLSGPMPNDAPVTVYGWIRAFIIVNRTTNRSSMINLREITIPLETVLQRNDIVHVFMVFIIFYNNRAVAIPRYYLDSRYTGFRDGNAHPKTYSIDGIPYNTKYPIGWGIEKSFRYLRGEID